jgi:hypothetical protein
LPDIEKSLWDLYREEGFAHRIEGGEQLDCKTLYRRLIQSKHLSPDEIFNLLCKRHEAAILEFAQILIDFLCRRKS